MYILGSWFEESLPLMNIIHFFLNGGFDLTQYINVIKKGRWTSKLPIVTISSIIKCKVRFVSTLFTLLFSRYEYNLFSSSPCCFKFQS